MEEGLGSFFYVLVVTSRVVDHHLLLQTLLPPRVLLSNDLNPKPMCRSITV